MKSKKKETKEKSEQKKKNSDEKQDKKNNEQPEIDNNLSIREEEAQGVEGDEEEGEGKEEKGGEANEGKKPLSPEGARDAWLKRRRERVLRRVQQVNDAIKDEYEPGKALQVNMYGIFKDKWIMDEVVEIYSKIGWVVSVKEGNSEDFGTWPILVLVEKE